MKVKNIVRKAVALGSGAALVGTTVVGAFAYDLSTYPAKYIVDGKFDGKIVVGEKAATADVIGSIDIAASLQGASVSKVAIPGQAGKTTLSGDVFRLETGSDSLELREPIGDVVDTVTESNLKGLKSGRITTSEGSTEYKQYLRLKDQAQLQNMSINYVENDDNKMGDYLVVDTSLPFLEWEVSFPSGLESKVNTGDRRMTDMEDRNFNMLGTDFNIVRASVATNNVVSMTLMGGSVPDTLREGETKTYTINGVDYEVTLVFVSDPNSGGSPEVKFSVNGEITQALAAGETDTLSGGLQIGVRDILVNAREGVASFYLGAHKVVIDDNAATNTFDGNVEINNENINDGDIDVYGQFTSGTSKYKITSIKYRLTMDAESGAVAYVPAGKGLRELMQRPQSLISDSLDVKYEGLEKVPTTDFQVRARGDDRYELVFTNIEGQKYTVPFVSNRNGVWKFGSENDDLVFAEPADLAATFNIGRNDYFIVSNDRTDGDKIVTNVLRFDDYDPTDKTVTFRDLATGSNFEVPVTNSTNLNGTGSLVIGGHTYAVGVSDVTSKTPNVNVDLNADGGAGDVVGITAKGGLVVAVTGVTNSSGDVKALGPLVSSNGVTLGNTGTSGYVNMTATVLAKNFDSSTVGEKFSWQITQAASNEVTLSFGASGYSRTVGGADPRANFRGTEYARFDFTDLDGDNERQVGMSDWGVMIQEYDPSGSNSPNELTLKVPESQVYGQVFVTMGATEASEGSAAGTADKVNPIAVGLAVLDKDAKGMFGKENLIIVGGPCANTVAMEFLGQPASCSEGFEPGKAMIKTTEKNGKVAILVAGYEATETLGASRVLADYKAYSLKGTEVEIVVADLNSIKVQTPK